MTTTTRSKTYQLTVHCRNGKTHTVITTDGEGIPVGLAQTHDLYNEECAPHSVQVAPVGSLPQQRRRWLRR